MNKSYGIHDKWTDLDRVNNIEIKSNDGVIEEITVNGEPAGGGDITTATVTIINNLSRTFECCTPYMYVDFSAGFLRVNSDKSKTVQVLLYEDGANFTPLTTPLPTITTTGAITEESGYYTITGDCTITVS